MRSLLARREVRAQECAADRDQSPIGVGGRAVTHITIVRHASRGARRMLIALPSMLGLIRSGTVRTLQAVQGAEDFFEGGIDLTRPLGFVPVWAASSSRLATPP